MKHFDEMGLLHEKAGYGGWILHGAAGRGWKACWRACGGAGAGGQVRQGGRNSRAAGGRHTHLRRYYEDFAVNSRSRVVW